MGELIRLPTETDITDYFGVQKGRDGRADCPMGMASVYYDLLNHLAIDASINPKGTSERLCAQQHLAYAGDSLATGPAAEIILETGTRTGMKSTILAPRPGVQRCSTPLVWY